MFPQEDLVVQQGFHRLPPPTRPGGAAAAAAAATDYLELGFFTFEMI